MLDILAITTPIFLIMATGYIAVAANIMPQNVVRGMGAFVMNFALPALLITSFSGRDLNEVLHGTFLVAYGGGSLIVFAIGLLFTRYIVRKSMPNAVLQGLGMSFCNSGFIGYPVALQLLGPPAVMALAMCMMIEILVMMPLVLLLGDSAAHDGQNRLAVLRKVVIGMGRNPIMLAIVAGLALSVSEITLPGPLFKAIDMLALTAGPTALFVIGGGLVGLRIRGMRIDMARIVTGKLILHPLAVFAMVWLLPPMDPVLQIAAVSFACSPMLSIYALFGQRYGHEGLCAASLMVATSLSFITISTALWILETTRVFGPLP
ncbi:MAG: AEC family transporter [Pseudomonadota bacterium]